MYLRAFCSSMLEVVILAVAELAEKPLNDWLCRLASDRPVYDCPTCKESAMQFFAQRLDLPGREDFFYCCACGSTWEV